MRAGKHHLISRQRASQTYLLVYNTGWEWYILLWCVTSAVGCSHQRAVHGGWYTEPRGNVTLGHKSPCTSKKKGEASEILAHEQIHKGINDSCQGEPLIDMTIKHKRPPGNHEKKVVEADFLWFLCFRAPPLQGLLPIPNLKSISDEVMAQEKLKCPEILLLKHERNFTQLFSNLTKIFLGRYPKQLVRMKKKLFKTIN